MATAKIQTRLIKQLKAKGFSQSAARAISTSSLQKSGDLKSGSNTPTSKGVRRGNMTPSQRAKDRAKTYSAKHKVSDYKYNKKTNRATLRNK